MFSLAGFRSKKRGIYVISGRRYAKQIGARHNGVVRNQINICRDTITVKFNTRHRPRGARVQCKFHASRGNAAQ